MKKKTVELKCHYFESPNELMDLAIKHKPLTSLCPSPWKNTLPAMKKSSLSDTPPQQRQKLNLNLIKFLEQNLQEMQRNKLKHTMEKQPAKSTLWESLQTTKFLQ